MKLIYKDQYNSIDHFDSVNTTTDFMVLTGVNGSGESHLLEAISKGLVEVPSIDASDIVLFNYEAFKLSNEGPFNTQQLRKECDDAWKYFNQEIKNNVMRFREQFIHPYEDIKGACVKEEKSILDPTINTLEKYRQNVIALLSNKRNKQNQQAQNIYSLAKRLPYSIDEIEHDEFVNNYKPLTLVNNFLPIRIGKIFWDYYVKYEENVYGKYWNEKQGKVYEVKTEEEFVALHGEKPWDLVNRILEQFDTLTYKVNSPEGLNRDATYQLKLKHTEKHDLEIDFSNLSSGERVLMALVASIYQSSSEKYFPDLLLLDEVDSSLHPSMMKNMLNVIENIFLSQGVKVILVTHSPTTIALSPEDSIFVMNRSGSQRVVKKKKQEALEILTQGFATIEQGLRLFDEVAKSDLTIITEGNNTKLIERALQLHEIDDVEVLKGAEGKSGQNQLKTLFDFFSRINHERKVLFVWDCDVKVKVTPTKNTYTLVLQKNQRNNIAKKGIENMFPEHLFNGFTTKISKSQGEVITNFDENRKRDFEKLVLSRNDINDFTNFSCLVEEIIRIKNN